MWGLWFTVLNVEVRAKVSELFMVLSLSVSATWGGTTQYPGNSVSNDNTRSKSAHEIPLMNAAMNAITACSRLLPMFVGVIAGRRR